MSNEVVVIVVAVGIVAAILALVITVGRGRNAKLRQVLTPAVSAAGWSDLRPISFLATGVRGMWRSHPVDLAYGARQKSVPQRFILHVRAASSSRLSVKRRMYGFLTRPFTLIGPPLVEMRNPLAQELWVRADEMAFAERVFSDEKATRLIAENLVAAFDEVVINAKGIRIMRSLDDGPVRQKYGFPRMTMSFEPERFAPIIREMLALAEALASGAARFSAPSAG